MKPILPKDLKPLTVEINNELQEIQKIKVKGNLKDKELLEVIIGYIIMYGGNLELLAPVVAKKNAYLGTVIKWFAKAIRMYAKHIKVKSKGL